VKSLSITWIKVKAHSGNIFNDQADSLAKAVTATTMASVQPSLINTLHLAVYGVEFSLTWNSLPWDGPLRKSLSTFAALPQNADWSRNSSIKPWFAVDGSNTVDSDMVAPSSSRPLLNNNNNNTSAHLSFNNNFSCNSFSNNISSSYHFSESRTYRWDILWTLVRTLRYRNRFGPTQSSFLTFVLKCCHNMLPTTDNLAKRLPHIYADWKCVFCHNQQESLAHLIDCPALSTNWQTVISSVLTFIQADLVKRQLHDVDIPAIQRAFSSPTALSHHQSPIQLAIHGVWPQETSNLLLRAGLHTQHTSFITSVLNHTLTVFHSDIWLERCKRQADQERLLGITQEAKRSYRSPPLITPTVSPPLDSTQTFFTQLKERWKDNCCRANAEFSSFVRQGIPGFNNGWALLSSSIKSINESWG
jgi:hypothetical protein